jgi:HAE1 family hydrophobic/amphiphilic exporter-1
VRNAIGTVRHKLPIEMREPVLQRLDPSAQPIMQLALSSSTQSHAEISRLAEDKLADRFRGIPGVAVVNVNGALKRELSVLLRAEKLREYDISISDITNALRNQNTTAPVGKVRGGLEDQSIRLVGRLESPADFEQIVVKRRGDETIRLGQLAQIRDGFAELASFSVRNGLPNVGLSVIRSRDASTVSVAAEARKVVKEIGKTLPPGTKLEVTQDGGVDAQNSLNNVVDALMFGAGLTIFVVYLFLNSWRSTLITALSLPTSVIAAFIAVWLCGFTLNFMTLLGLSLAIGVLIDDAIVVRENIVRHMERGEDRRTAALNGTAEIGLAVAATTFSIVAVFIPVAFMPGVSGEWFRPFGLTVVASVLVSLFISFTLDPMLSAVWGDPPGHHLKPKTGISKLLAGFNHWFDHQADRYGRVIAWALHHRIWMFFFAIASFVGAVALQFALGGWSFLPTSDYGTIAIEVRTPSSSNLEYARLKVEAAASLARTLPETKATNSTVNVGGGRVYVDVGKSPTRKRSAVDIAKELRVQTARLVGAEYTVLDDLNNGAQKPVQIRFTGPRLALPADDRQRLHGQAARRAWRGRRRHDRTGPAGRAEDRARPRPGQRARHLGQRCGAGLACGLCRHRDRRLDRPDRRSARRGGAAASAGPCRGEQHRAAADRGGGSNRTVPLEQIATVTMGKGPSQIQHSDTKRTISVSPMRRTARRARSRRTR